MEYESYLNQVIEGKPISLLCTYPLSSCKAGDILDVVRAHEVALAKQQDRWSVIETHLTNDSPAALEAASRVASLFLRERQVLTLVSDGVVTKNIAFELSLSVRTIEVHRERAVRGLAFAPWSKRSDCWSGLYIVNPPYAFTQALPPLLRALRAALAPEGHKGEIISGWLREK